MQQLLMIEDDVRLAQMVGEYLRSAGFGFNHAVDGRSGLVALHDSSPDLVILDLNMPGLGGAGTLPRLRALCPTLPVLVATGRADQSALDLVNAHDHVTLLAKPFSLEELKQHIQSLPLGPAAVGPARQDPGMGSWSS